MEIVDLLDQIVRSVYVPILNRNVTTVYYVTKRGTEIELPLYGAYAIAFTIHFVLLACILYSPLLYYRCLNAFTKLLVFLFRAAAILFAFGWWYGFVGAGVAWVARRCARFGAF